MALQELTELRRELAERRHIDREHARVVSQLAVELVAQYDGKPPDRVIRLIQAAGHHANGTTPGVECKYRSRS